MALTLSNLGLFIFFRVGTAEAYKKATEFSNRLKEEDAYRYRRTVLTYALMACREVVPN